jgi:plastocyanin
MHKLLVVAVALISLAAAGAAAETASPAATATKTVKITHTGYQPTSVSITVGDSVVFTNDDTVAHTVQFKTTTGMNCTAALPLVLAPGKSATCTFSSAGKFDFSDPANNGSKFHGTVNVAKPAAVSLRVSPRVVVYGGKVSLNGTLASQQSGQSLQIFAQQCGASAATKLATVTTTTGGAYTYQTQPLKETTYTVKSKNSTSSATTVKVHPRLRLGKLARHHYSVRVFAAQSFAGKYANFQRYRPALHRWKTVKRVLLKANPNGVAPTVITSAKFRSHIRTGLRVRLLLSQAQAGTCYLAGHSNTIRS